MRPEDIDGLAAATGALGGAILGPRELEAALGFDPLAVLTREEWTAVSRLPFGGAELERARNDRDAAARPRSRSTPSAGSASTANGSWRRRGTGRGVSARIKAMPRSGNL